MNDSNNIDDNDENHTKITVYDFFSINEIKIGEIIEEIPYYRNYYDILTDYDFIDIGKIGEKIIKIQTGIQLELVLLRV